MAILEGLQNLFCRVSYPIRVEIDSIEVVKLLQKKEDDLSKIVWVIHEIMCSKDICLSKVDRDKNGSAYSLCWGK